jgi:hypothetical protein
VSIPFPHPRKSVLSVVKTPRPRFLAAPIFLPNPNSDPAPIPARLCVCRAPAFRSAVAKEGLRRQCLFPIRENPRYPWLKFSAPVILSNMILSIPPIVCGRLPGLQ